VKILQWEMTHNDPLFKALTMSLLLYYVDYLLFPIMGGLGKLFEKVSFLKSAVLKSRF
jgi:hypothetical protein